MTTSETQIPVAAPTVQAMQGEAASFNLRLVLRLSTFHVGSAMGDILTAGVWNRIMISDFGIPAWPVGLLIALKNFMAPISIWVGHRSDTRPLWGWQRTSYIWLGRTAMWLSFPLLGFSTIRLERDTGDGLGWLVASLTFLLYGLGTLLSGSPFLALVRDSVPRAKQGIAIGLVQTTLIGLFPIVAVGFSRMLVTYDPAMFWRLILFVMAVGGFFWLFAVAAVERGNGLPGGGAVVERIDLRETFASIWGDPRTQRFFVFLFVSTFAAWLQENILEPFGAEVFTMEVRQTTRLTGYWGTATILVLLGSFVIWRRQRPEQHKGVTQIGLAIMALGMGIVVASSFAGRMRLFLVGLVIYGAGFGLYTFGGLSLMAVMSPDPHSGAYLGLWTVAILVARGLGTFVGGLSRDVLLTAGLPGTVAYGLTLSVAVIGLLAAIWIAKPLDVLAFARDTDRLEPGDLFSAGIEI